MRAAQHTKPVVHPQDHTNTPSEGNTPSQQKCQIRHVVESPQTRLKTVQTVMTGFGIQDDLG